MNVSKKEIVVYLVRAEDNSFGWSDIAIDDHIVDDSERKRNPFRISISSDYGSWSYYWSCPGECWRKFLLSVKIDYVSSKLGLYDEFDADATKRNLKSDLLRYRRQERQGEKDIARSAWDAIETAFSEYSSPDLIQNYLVESEWSTFWGDCWIDFLRKDTRINTQFKAFWDGPWQHFLNKLKEELVIRSNE